MNKHNILLKSSLVSKNSKNASDNYNFCRVTITRKLTNKYFFEYVSTKYNTTYLTLKIK